METCLINLAQNLDIVTLSDDESHSRRIEKLKNEEWAIQNKMQDLNNMIIYQENDKLHEPSKEKVSNIDGEKIKMKKMKGKKCRGEKRKLSDKVEICKKVKHNKKEEKSTNGSPTENLNENRVSSFLIKTPKFKTSTMVEEPRPIISMENDSDAENHDIPVKEKSKQMSARKSKAVTNACRETLNVLLKMELDTLESMDKSLKILKSHNFLSNKLIPIDTLMDLISLALHTSKGAEILESEKEMNISKIVSKLVTETCKTPKACKVKQNILFASVSPKTKLIKQDEVQSISLTAGEIECQPIVNLEEKKELVQKMEDCSAMLEAEEKEQEPTVEKSGNNFCITNYFKKLKKTVDETNQSGPFSSFTTKTDMFIAPKLRGELSSIRRKIFEEEFNNQTSLVNYLLEQEQKRLFRQSAKYNLNQKKYTDGSVGNESGNNLVSIDLLVNNEAIGELKVNSEKNQKNFGTDVSIIRETHSAEVGLISVKKVITPIRAVQVLSRTKAKLLQFHDNRRPPYWGTWRRKSTIVGGRRPFSKDKIFNYDIDSDDEWEGEEEPGESLHGSDDEKEPEEDYEVDNDFFVPHGYLSDDENPERENLSPKTKLNSLEEFAGDHNQKTRKMMPIVFGTFWVDKGLPPEGNLFQDLQLNRLHIFPWTSCPILIEDEEETRKNENTADQETTNQLKKSRTKRGFPLEEIPKLIQIIHGSPLNSDNLAKKFLDYWGKGKSFPEGKRSSLTKICVLKKIKELATWQAGQEKGKMRWWVPKETIEEFGAKVEEEKPEKKTQKCYLWKFVKKGEKDGGLGGSTESRKPEIVFLEN